MSTSKTIFLTGFPGFIAGRLVEKLAIGNVQFYLLVQSQFVEKAMSEVEGISERSGLPLENFALIEGDITRSNLGIDPQDLETIRSEINDIFHLAAAYDLAVP